MKHLYMWGLVATLWASAASADTMSVQVKQTPLRSGPSFLGAVVTQVVYGDAVTVLEERAGWANVQTAAGKRGWVHGSALSEKRIVLRGPGGEVTTGASSDEVALAGKGFNQQVEKKYKKENRDLDYAAVDRMEKRVVSRNAMIAFVKEGDLGKGGAK